ncbi:hypothetical protein IV203_012593 [Nitzschia inconspicua]|uniref:Uncharacterized protein n=1 Tax=Nitzschia inconspicua TaxID=303405 RepID=A0A9K3KV68_9STRA|nr:hypothetical protein IV203_012593 [Nitzschia inconspicua]
MITNSLVQVVFRLNRRRVQDENQCPNIDHTIDDAKKLQARSRKNKEHYPDALHSKTIMYGDPQFEAKRNFKGHQNQGYFNKETTVADDRMYQH